MASSLRPTTVPAALVLDLGAQLVRAAVLAVVGGVTLGLWCRQAVGSGPVASVLAEIGAPWVATAFVLGALATRRHRLADTATGALAGAGGLAVASVAYYGAAHPVALAWAVTGLVVGAAAGAAGSCWRSDVRSPVAVVAVTAVGLAISAEAAALLLTGSLGPDPSVRPVVLAIAAVGVAAPLLLCPVMKRAALGAIAVALLAGPSAVVLTTLAWAFALHG